MVDKNGFISYKIFESFKNLVAFTSTKQSLDVQYPRFTGDSGEIFTINREILSKKVGIAKENLVFPRQTHTNCIVNIDSIPKKEMKDTDALITNKRGVCVCVQTADCVPILLYDPVQHVIAAIHAGWRGTVKKIVANSVLKMISDYNSSPEDMIAAIGPSIGPEMYEVGEEVVNEAKSSIPNADLTLHKTKSGAFNFDLWEANKQLLLEHGILEKHIQILGECTFRQENKYFSARREGIHTGRMVSGIMLK